MSQREHNISIPNTVEHIRLLEGYAGVYMYTRKGIPLYIGKSVNIKVRLLSHLENARTDEKEAKYVEGSDELTLYRTDSEFNALLLESHLIQKHKPKYNVRLRDDKSYLYIKITVKDEFPKVYHVRKENDGTSRYFGPFSSTFAAEQIIKTIRRVFPFCTQQKTGTRPCFYSKIGLCNPCPNVIQTQEQKKIYRKNIRNVIRTLEGRSEVVQKELFKEMNTLSEHRRYEEALLIRNKLIMFENMFAHRLYSNRDEEGYNRSAKNTDELVVLLRNYLPELQSVRRIECYDISNLSQRQCTASMVVFIDGQIARGEYKKFKIRVPRNISDFAMLEQVIERRFRNRWERPDLIVVDGGRPQVRIIRNKLKEIEVAIPLIGIAKNPDRIVVGTSSLPTIRPRLNNSGFNLIQHLRDESHRFAKKYHIYLRNKHLFPQTGAF